MHLQSDTRPSFSLSGGGRGQCSSTLLGRSHAVPRVRWGCNGCCRVERRDVHTRAASNEEERSPSPLLACNSAVNELMQALSSGTAARLDSLLEFVPDYIIDKCIEARKSSGLETEPLSFEDIQNLLRVGDFAQASDLLFDSHAMRLLVFQTPSSAVLLSSLMASDSKSIHRILVQSGKEECVLTFNMQLQEGLIGQYRSAPKISKTWRLKSITGDTDNSAELPAQADASVGPELVVQAQLDALRRGDVSGVYEFASPQNKAATGGSLTRFRRLFDHPMYKPLLGLTKSESLRRIQLTQETYAEVVGVVSNNTGMDRQAKFVYVWSVGRVPEDISPEKAGCWMTNSVQLVSASDPSMWPPPAP